MLGKRKRKKNAWKEIESQVWRQTCTLV